jgi:hypothetical protein
MEHDIYLVPAAERLGLDEMKIAHFEDTMRKLAGNRQVKVKVHFALGRVRVKAVVPGLGFDTMWCERPDFLQALADVMDELKSAKLADEGQ